MPHLNSILLGVTVHELNTLDITLTLNLKYKSVHLLNKKQTNIQATFKTMTVYRQQPKLHENQATISSLPMRCIIKTRRWRLLLGTVEDSKGADNV